MGKQLRAMGRPGKQQCYQPNRQYDLCGNHDDASCSFPELSLEIVHVTPVPIVIRPFNCGLLSSFTFLNSPIARW